MDMNDVIVIDEADDELEEGEIADDEIPVVEVLVEPEVKPKQLPRRYSLYDKGSNSGHKKCKRKDRNKLPIPSNLETNHRKKHKTSCPRHSSENYRLKRRDVHHSHNSFAIKSAFKNYTSPPRVPPIQKQAVSNTQNSEIEVNFHNFLSACKKAKKLITQRIEKAQNIEDRTSQENESVLDMNDGIKTNISQEKHELPFVHLTEDKNEEKSDEEDVDELRRIALATRAKKQIIKVSGDDSSNEILKPCSINLPSPNTVLSNHVVSENDNDSRDNYEVVDMDLDEEENSCQIKNSLFVIDKIPAITAFSPQPVNSQNIQSPISPERSTIYLQSNHSQHIDDFEEQLLRAEVIASMNVTRQKCQSPPKFLNHLEDQVPESIAKVDMLHNTEIDMLHNTEVDMLHNTEVDMLHNTEVDMLHNTEVEMLHNTEVDMLHNTEVDMLHNTEVDMLHIEVKPKPCAMYSKGPLQNFVRQPPKRIIDANSKFISFKNNKTIASQPPPRGVNTVQQRLIITLNNDTSTDESEDENVATQNVPIESIEALISNARQKSDAAKINSESSINVSCLSKAQQEEYNLLKKLLAQKSQYSLTANIVQEKTLVDRSHVNLLIKKISVAKANLLKEKGIKTQVEKEVTEKKNNYMISKLKVQLLKEKLHAAEKIRGANLEKWKQSTAKLDIVKKSVSKREALVKALETDLTTNSVCMDSNTPKPPVLK